MNIYKFIFSKIFHILENFYDPFYSDLKAVAIIFIIEQSLLTTLFLFLYDNTYGFYDSDSMFINILFIVNVIHKYYYFYYENKWKLYLREYKSISKGLAGKLNIIFWSILIVSIVLCVVFFNFRTYFLVES